MAKQWIRLLVVTLVAVLLAGCSEMWSDGVVAYEDMEYERPDMARMEKSLQLAVEAAKDGKLPVIEERIYDFYDEYDWFYTCYSLAELQNFSDMSDLYWQDEYGYCVKNSTEADAMMEELYTALAKSPCRSQLESEEYFGAGYFDSYEDGKWDSEFVVLLEKENELEMRYLDCYGDALDRELEEDPFAPYADELAAVLVELIRVRQEIADYCGYENYIEYASDVYYYRDYTAKQAEIYLKDIQTEMVPLYRQVCQSDIWDENLETSTEQDTFAYVRDMAWNMDGKVQNAFRLLDKANLYDLEFGENKFQTSYEVYLTSYREPFIFLCPTGSNYDHLTFAHEFGHFCADWAAYGSYAGADVQEVFSQGMEYLSLCYGENTEKLTKLKMADSLCLYVEQAAYASFEQQMYSLTGEDLRVEELYSLYEKTVQQFGMDSVAYDPWEFVTVSHFYTDPMYIISYLVSNDAALQLYQMEMEEKGMGLAWLEEHLDSEELYILAFLENAGLENPFGSGRISAVRQMLERVLN